MHNLNKKLDVVMTDLPAELPQGSIDWAALHVEAEEKAQDVQNKAACVIAEAKKTISQYKTIMEEDAGLLEILEDPEQKEVKFAQLQYEKCKENIKSYDKVLEYFSRQNLFTEKEIKQRDQEIALKKACIDLQNKIPDYIHEYLDPEREIRTSIMIRTTLCRSMIAMSEMSIALANLEAASAIANAAKAAATAAIEHKAINAEEVKQDAEQKTQTADVAAIEADQAIANAELSKTVAAAVNNSISFFRKVSDKNSSIAHESQMVKKE